MAPALPELPPLLAKEATASRPFFPELGVNQPAGQRSTSSLEQHSALGPTARYAIRAAGWPWLLLSRRA
jgi:hypothetical protein